MEKVKRQFGPGLVVLLQAKGLNVREHLDSILAEVLELARRGADRSTLSGQIVRLVAEIENASGGANAKPQKAVEGGAAWCRAVDTMLRESTGPQAALVMESDPVQRKFVATILARAGWTVNSAATGDEGLWLSSKLRYELIIIDHQLSAGTGSEAAEEIRAGSGPNSDTYILGTSAKDHRKECLAAGMDEYLQKPIDLTMLKYRALRVASGTDAASSVP
jgi:CheY-like chemotaxis protein